MYGDAFKGTDKMIEEAGKGLNILFVFGLAIGIAIGVGATLLVQYIF